MKIYGNDGNVIIGNSKYKVIKNENNILTVESNEGLKCSVPVIGSNGNEIEIDQSKIVLSEESKTTPTIYYANTTGMTKDDFCVWNNGLVNGQKKFYYEDSANEDNDGDFSQDFYKDNTILLRVRNFKSTKAIDYINGYFYIGDDGSGSSGTAEYAICYGCHMTASDGTMFAPIMLEGRGSEIKNPKGTDTGDYEMFFAVNDYKDHATIGVRWSDSYKTGHNHMYQDYTLDGKTWLPLPLHNDDVGFASWEFKAQNPNSSGEVSLLHWNKKLNDLSIFFPDEKQTTKLYTEKW